MQSEVAYQVVEVTFIIIAYNARLTIRQCIESVLAQNVSKQVVLVDNHSTDGMIDAVRDFPITILFEPERCRGLARNRGLEVAIGQYIAFVDSDVELPLDWARKALCLLKKHLDVAGVGGPGLTPEGSWVSKAQDVLQYGSWLDEEEKGVSSLPTMDIMYRGTCIRPLRFAHVWAGEDPELNFRLTEQGFRFLWSRELSVVHHHVTSLGQLVRRTYRYGMWFPALYRRHPKQITLDVLFRGIYFPILVFLTILYEIWPLVGWLGGLWLLLPFLLYTYAAVRGNRFAGFKEGLQFVIVHSIKQYALMAGIWAGVIRGTGRGVIDEGRTS